MIRFVSVFALLILLAGLCTAGSGQSGDVPAKHVPHEVLVRFSDRASESEKAALRSRINAKLLEKIRSIRVERWSLPEDCPVAQAIEILEASGIVRYAEPNYLYEPQRLPNDPQIRDLWYLDNTGQTVNQISGTYGADISAERAWDLQQGDAGMVIAVIDSGVAYDHPDLAGNIWSNPGEIPDNRIDDDRNGYVDDVRGWDFANSDNNPQDYSADVQSDGHGTHVAGIIAARGDNGRGITGVMWRAQIMPLQIFDLFGGNTFGTAVIQENRILSAIEYAVDNGARIVNCSFGGSAGSRNMYAILQYADQNGVLVVAAAGNDRQNNDFFPTYPAAYDLPNIIAVAATDQNDGLASYSNYGPQSVDIGAPGGSGVRANMLSTTPPERITLFSDDFDAGLDQWETFSLQNDWSIGSHPDFGSAVLQSAAGEYANNEDARVFTDSPIPAADSRGLILRFDTVFDLEADRDFFFVEVSSDGSNYSAIASATGTSGGRVGFLGWPNELELDQIYLRLRLVTDGTVVDDGIYIDNLELSGIPWRYTGSAYNFKSGTSMAAPIVSGVAGLIWSHSPSLSHLDVKEILLDSADPLAALDGITVTGGRVNARSAVAAAGETTGGGGSGGGGGCFIEVLTLTGARR